MGGWGSCGCLFCLFFFFQAEEGIGGAEEAGGLGDVYKGEGRKNAERSGAF